MDAARSSSRGLDQQVAKGVDFIKLWIDDEFGDLPLRMPAEISRAIIDQAHEHKLRAIAHIFYLHNAKTLVPQRVDGFAHSVRDQPVDQALLAAMKRHGSAQMAATLSREASFTYTKLRLLGDPFFTPAAYAIPKPAGARWQLFLPLTPREMPRPVPKCSRNVRRVMQWKGASCPVPRWHFQRSPATRISRA